MKAVTTILTMMVMMTMAGTYFREKYSATDGEHCWPHNDTGIIIIIIVILFIIIIIRERV